MAASSGYACLLPQSPQSLPLQDISYMNDRGCQMCVKPFILKPHMALLVFCFTAHGEQLILVMKHHPNMCITTDYSILFTP